MGQKLPTGSLWCFLGAGLFPEGFCRGLAYLAFRTDVSSDLSPGLATMILDTHLDAWQSLRNRQAH